MDSDESFDKLDKMAQEINNKHEKQNNIMSKNYNKKRTEVCRGIECLMEPQNSKYLPSPYNVTELSQSDFKSGLPTPLEKSDTVSLLDSSNTSISLPNNLSSETINSFPDKVKSHLKTQTKHVNDNDTNEFILEHIKHCDFCKQHLLNILTPERQVENNNNVITLDEIKKYSFFIFIGIIIVLIIEVILKR
jgi:hypothetical protein